MWVLLHLTHLINIGEISSPHGWRSQAQEDGCWHHGSVLWSELGGDVCEDADEAQQHGVGGIKEHH